MSTQWKTPPSTGIPYSDTQRAQRFNDWLDDTSRYIFSWKLWAHWGDGGWTLDPAGGEIVRRAIDFGKTIMDEAQEVQGKEEREQAFRGAMALQSHDKIQAMISVLKSFPNILAEPSDFDSCPYKLGVPNGVIDLKTGAHRETEKDDMILKHMAVSYDADAKCPMWEEFLEQVLPEADVRDFLQRAIGYSATGLTTEQKFFFLYGMGQNGKSTFIDTLFKLFGDYAWAADNQLFLETKTDETKQNQLASLPEKRFVLGAEMTEKGRFAENTVKDITSGGSINARKLYCEAFNFTPTHKLWLYGNYKPTVLGTDDGIWRRLAMVPFNQKIEEAKRDTNILARLWTEAPGILNWVLKGCLAWQKHGLKAPASVLQAVQDYRDEEDLVHQFVEEECQMEGEISRQAIVLAYTQWEESNGWKFHKAPKMISDRISKLPGVGTRMSHGVRIWTGLSLKDPAAFKGLKTTKYF